MDKMGSVLQDVWFELTVATCKHGPFHSPHEGYGVIAEEFAELLDAIRANDGDAIRGEAIQVAAMAIRLVMDCCERHGKECGCLHCVAGEKNES